MENKSLIRGLSTSRSSLNPHPTPPHRFKNPPILEGGWKSQANTKGKRNQQSKGQKTLQRAKTIAEGEQEIKGKPRKYSVWNGKLNDSGAQHFVLHPSIPTLLRPLHPHPTPPQRPKNSPVAQWSEQWFCEPGVGCSSPA